MRAARDELAGVAVALGAADAAAVAKPEAGLAEGAGQVARILARRLGGRMGTPVRVVCGTQQVDISVHGTPLLGSRTRGAEGLDAPKGMGQGTLPFQGAVSPSMASRGLGLVTAP